MILEVCANSYLSAVHAGQAGAHRIELCSEMDALQLLMQLGVNRVLTSGQETSAKKGTALLLKLKELAKGQITMLLGGGINPNNALLFKQVGFFRNSCFGYNHRSG